MSNSKNNGRGRKASKSDYMRAARKQRQQENIFFDELEQSLEEAVEIKNQESKRRKKHKTAGGDEDEW